MSNLTEPKEFTVRLGGPDTVPIGEFGIDAQGRITLLVADDAYRQPLDNIVEYVNGLEKLRIKAPVPGGEPGAITREEVARDDPRLTQGIIAFMEEKYNLYLQPVSE
jgi:hypothetical protein